MAGTNFKQANADKLATWMGERKALEVRIANINRELTELPSLSSRLTALNSAIAGLESAMKFDDPAFDQKAIKPRQKAAHHSPIPMGQCSRTTLDVLREAAKPLTAREIGRLVLERFDVSNPERDVLDRVTNTINAYLSSNEGSVVRHDGRSFSRAWEVIR